MKKLLPLLITLFLTGCSLNTNNSSNENGEEEKTVSFNDYGAFLGRSENNTKNFGDYKYVSIEFDEYEKNTISALKSQKIECFAYLNIGSLETYRSYYSRFEKYAFLDYENWDDEKWIDITNNEWQEFVIETLATNFKNKGASGVYLDNVDVYSIFRENDKDYLSAATAIKNIITRINDLGLKILMNGGAEFIDDMNDKKDSILSSIWAYHQEEVFSLITDYDNNKFGKQNFEDSSYYKLMAKIMKNKGAEIFLLEYTKDQNLVKKIKDFCEANSYHYYCSETVDLL